MTGNDQSVHITTCAICGYGETFCTVKSVVVAVDDGEAKSTSKYGSSSVAAGRKGMSQPSSANAGTARRRHKSNRRIARWYAVRRDVVYFFAFNSASTSSACFAVSTFFQIFLIRPSAPIQYVVRATPQ